MPSLTSAIEKAVETHKEEVQQTTEQQVETPSVETKVETPPTVEEPEVDLDAANGKVLIQALRDPEKAAFVIDALARQAGYSKIESKQEVKEAKDDINAILEKHLGDEFKFLAPKLGPAIKEALENIKTSNADVTDLRQRVERQELQEIRSETERAHTTIAREYFNADDMPDNVVAAMDKAMDTFQPSADMTPEQYYRKIFYMVVGELGITKKSPRGQAVSERNRSDSAVRQLTSQDRGIVPDTKRGNAKPMSLKDSVRAAIQQVDAQQNK